MTRVAPGLTPAERRALLRRHHPDLGGDPEDFVRVMAAIESLRGEPALPQAGRADPPAGAPASSPSREGTTQGGSSARTRRSRRARRALVRLRAALPRRVPGARRYGHL